MDGLGGASKETLVKIRKIGEVAFEGLDQDIRTDVAYAIGLKTGALKEGDIEDSDLMEDARSALEGTDLVLPLVEVNPEEVLKISPRSISKVAARKYAEMMMVPTEIALYERHGLQIPPGKVIFPPVVIDSSLKKGVLREGGHRTLAAKMLGIPWIEAIDIAHI
jgi:hypothetical protein